MLNPATDSATTYGFACRSGSAGQAVYAANTSVQPTWGTTTEPWYLIQAAGDADADGTQAGFDCELTRAISRATKIPVIASGGGGKPEDFIRVLTEGEADAALAASIFHYGTFTVNDLKEVLDKEGIAVRPQASATNL